MPDGLAPKPDWRGGRQAATAAPAIAVRGLAVSFAGKPVLRGIDLDVAAGSAVALIGANGAGKSTFLRALIRLTESDGGTIAMLGRSVRSLSGRSLAEFRSEVGFVFQRHNLVPRLSALSNVVHGVQSRSAKPSGWFQWLASRAVREEAMACLDKVDLAEVARQKAENLSGGQSQRVAIARMLMQRPKAILADEPDASLDPVAGAEVMSLLSGLARREGLTFVFVSHRMEHARAHADRIVGLEGGRIAFDVPARQASARMLSGFFNQEAA